MEHYPKMRKITCFYIHYIDYVDSIKRWICSWNLEPCQMFQFIYIQTIWSGNYLSKLAGKSIVPLPVIWLMNFVGCVGSGLCVCKVCRQNKWWQLLIINMLLLFVVAVGPWWFDVVDWNSWLWKRIHKKQRLS